MCAGKRELNYSRKGRADEKAKGEREQKRIPCGTSAKIYKKKKKSKKKGYKTKKKYSAHPDQQLDERERGSHGAVCKRISAGGGEG